MTLPSRKINQNIRRKCRRSHTASIACLYLGTVFCFNAIAGPQDSATLETDNSATFVQYFSINPIPEVIAGYKNANRPGPVIVSHPLRTHSSGSVPGRNSVYPAQYLIDLTEGADLIIVGRPSACKSLMMDDQSFIYSNFIFTADQVLLDRDDKIVPGDEFYVTRAGGTLTIKDMEVRAVDPEFDSFELGAKYLLFLKRLPNSKFLKATAPASFALDKDHLDGTDGIAKRLDNHPLEQLSPDSGTGAELILEVVNAIGAAAREQ